MSAVLVLYDAACFVDVCPLHLNCALPCMIAMHCWCAVLHALCTESLFSLCLCWMASYVLTATMEDAFFHRVPMMSSTDASVDCKLDQRNVRMFQVMVHGSGG